MKLKKKLTKIVIAMSFLAVSVFSMADTANYSDYSALLVGDSKGNIYKENNVNAVRPIASITKVMTSLLVLDKINNREISFDTKVTVSKKAASVPYGIKLVAGKQYTIRDLLKATIIKSSNNAAYALAEYVGNGNVNTFVNMMNDRARELGLSSLRYCSPHGLPPSYTNSCMDQGNARDLYKLATLAVQYRDYLNISENATDYIDDGNTKLTSTNTLLGKVIGVDGLKTGYHDAAGSNIILTAQRGGDRTIVVVLGSRRAANRNAIGTREINNYYSEMRKTPIATVSTKENGTNRNNTNNEKNGNIVGNIFDTIFGNKDKNIDKDQTSQDLLQNVKLVDKNVSLAKVKIGNERFELYPKDDIIIKGDPKKKINPKIKIEVDKKNISASSVGQTVGTFTVKYGNEEYIGALIMK